MTLLLAKRQSQGCSQAAQASQAARAEGGRITRTIQLISPRKGRLIKIYAQETEASQTQLLPQTRRRQPEQSSSPVASRLVDFLAHSFVVLGYAGGMTKSKRRQQQQQQHVGKVSVKLPAIQPQNWKWWHAHTLCRINIVSSLSLCHALFLTLLRLMRWHISIIELRGIFMTLFWQLWNYVADNRFGRRKKDWLDSREYI